MRRSSNRLGLSSLAFAILTLSGCASLLDIEEGQPKPGGTSGGGGSGGRAGVGGNAGGGGVGNAGGAKGGAAGNGQGGGGTSSGGAGAGAGAGQGGANGGTSGAQAGKGGVGGFGGLGGKAGTGGVSAGSGGVASGNGGTSAGKGGAGAGQGGGAAGSAGEGGSGGTTSGGGGDAGSSSGGDAGSTSGGGGDAGATSGGSAGADGGVGGVGGSGAGTGGTGAGVGGSGAGVGGSGAGFAGSGGSSAGFGGGGSSAGNGGSGGSGALGCNSTGVTPCSTPGVACTPSVTNLPLEQIVAGDRFTCALATGAGRNDVWCWGDNSVGQLARPASCVSSGVAMKVPLPDAIATASSPILIAGPTAEAACLLAANQAYCWGQIAGVDVAQWGVTTPAGSFASPISGSVGRNFVFARFTSGTYVRGNGAMIEASQVDFPAPDFWTTVPGGPKVAASSAASCAATTTPTGGGGGFGGGTQQISMSCAGAAQGCLLADEAGPCVDEGTIGATNWKYTPPNTGQCCSSPNFDLELSDSVGCIAVGSGAGGSPSLQCWGADVVPPVAGLSPVPTEVPYVPSGAGGGPSGGPGNLSFAVGDRFVAQARGSFGTSVQLHGAITDEDSTPITPDDSPPFRLANGMSRQLAAGRRHLCAIATVPSTGTVVQCVGSNAQRQSGSPSPNPVKNTAARFITFQKLLLQASRAP